MTFADSALRERIVDSLSHWTDPTSRRGCWNICWNRTNYRFISHMLKSWSQDITKKKRSIWLPLVVFLLGGNRSRDTHLEHPKEIMIYNILILNSNFGANVWYINILVKTYFYTIRIDDVICSSTWQDTRQQRGSPQRRPSGLPWQPGNLLTPCKVEMMPAMKSGVAPRWQVVPKVLWEASCWGPSSTGSASLHSLRTIGRCWALEVENQS